MNRHFEDARYYLKRTAETAKRGVAAELEPVGKRVRSLVGEAEPEPTRREKARVKLAEVRREARRETEAVAEDVRGRVASVRKRSSD